MMLSRWFYIISIASVLGIVFYLFFQEYIQYGICVGLVVAFAVAVIFFFEKDFEAKRFLLGFIVCVLAFCVGGIRMVFNDYKADPMIISFIEEEIIFEGVVVAEPDKRETNTHLTMSVEKINGQDTELDNRLLIFAENYPEFLYGDRLEVKGKLDYPEDFVTEAGRLFAYKDYLAKDDIYFVVYFPEIKKIGQSGNVFLKNLFSLKKKFLKKISNILPEPHASLAGGEILGTKQALGEDILDDFRATGVIHIVVLSGYNVAIVADAISKGLSFLPRYIGGFLGIISIIVFALVTGAGATIIRASIMASLVILARLFGRQADALRLLVLAGVLMVFHNPRIILDDISFQLSFLATFGLISLSPIIEKYFKWLPERFGIREIAVATISTQIFVLPLLVYAIGELSLISLPANLLVLLAVPATMLFGFLTGLVSFILPILSVPIGYVAYLLLEYQFSVVGFFAKLPFASVQVPPMHIVFMIIIYIVILYCLYKKAPLNRGA